MSRSSINSSYVKDKLYMKKFIIRTLVCNIFFSISLIANAQSNITLNESPVIKRLNSYFIEHNLKRSEFPGWRIQVFASTDRKEMENILARFRASFPGYFAKWILNDPYYQVRAGMFTDYSEAMKALQDVRKIFRSSTLITDRIRREEILNL